MPPCKPNSKVVAANAKKAENDAKKQAETDAQREKKLQDEWSVGANLKGRSRNEAAAMKADEAARKKREKLALLEAEESGFADNVKSNKKPAAGKKGKKKKGNDLSLLEDALVSGAEKKVKAKKKTELLKKEKAEADAKKRAEAASVATEKSDPLIQNTQDMLSLGAGRAANVATMQEGEMSGIDGALKTLNVSSGTDVKSQKALYLAYEERMLPQVKDDYPGLRLTQYKEKIFDKWKKSPENPKNQIPS
mmetsp:Transcript_39405/g.58526  ORF Transcript_39405/g.58526 Transcript_39405/m.58526 type:complete len:250 (-) Transcript_39405:223-972(-)|eukprot:CAMPEP_0194038212 /NCGR_PEP_ID=MMETSP0009_2-20130614/10471_1 /TAXON_ID=210454 /ORGANISM="Grammatophora oceanica, Strain CCMP 410" /LENGTH=249 /DNA_ID=CAMNT_0038680643 /DNA_START=104 /DNA_END=853 /DNA_ORIENTATION=+